MRSKKTETRAKLLRIIQEGHKQDFFQSIYTPDVIQALATTHGMSQRVDALCDALKTATDYYLLGGPFLSHDVPELENTASQFERLAEAARALSEAYEKMPDRFAQSLLAEFRDAGAHPDAVSSVVGLVDCDNDRRARFFAAYAFTATERHLRALAERVKPRKRRSGKGRPEEYGLESFVAALADFWTHIAKRGFTVDYHRGAPLTPTLAFLADAIAPLDDVPPAAVITAARKIRREMGTHKK